MKSESSSDPTNPITTPTPHLLPVASYQMEGLTCGHCAGRVTEAVQALPLVDGVQVDLAAGGSCTVTVTGAVSAEEARQANEEVGYAAF